MSTKTETSTKTPFILVFRPHQRPAWADSFDSESQLIDAWANGEFERACFAKPSSETIPCAACDGEGCDACDGNGCTWIDEEMTIDNALASLGHDLHGLTRLDSAEEVDRYLREPDYCGRHNRGEGAVRRAAKTLGWLPPSETAKDEGDDESD